MAWVTERQERRQAMLATPRRRRCRPSVGMPLEENGLISAYGLGRLRYEGLRTLLPLKLEQLRRAVDAERQRADA
ncbi:hypothetical protein [Streptomyces atratus]|uniref:hypothetical protein n=1 Tax=Streptomyces atratus TaxID=1893 RepID=UPI00340D4E5A